MSTVHPPSLNKLNGGYSSSHKAYDHDDIPDNRAFCSLKNASVVQVVDKYLSSWNQGQTGDPTPGGLTTEDYGNFVKLSGQDFEGNWLYQISAHLVKGIPVQVGQKLQMGELIGTIGNNQADTGNSTGGHLHTEYRNQSDTNIPVTFKQVEQPKENTDMEYQQFFTKFMEAFKKHRDDIDWGPDKHKSESDFLEDVAILGRVFDEIARAKKQREEDNKNALTQAAKTYEEKLKAKIDDLNSQHISTVQDLNRRHKEELEAAKSATDPTAFSQSIAVLEGKADDILNAFSLVATKSQQEKISQKIEAIQESIENENQPEDEPDDPANPPTEGILSKIINIAKGAYGFN